MLLVNPKIDGSTTNVPNILNGLNRKATSLTVSGTIAIPPWFGLTYHYQGIAPYNGYGGPTIGNGVISASSTVGYFSGFSQAQGEAPTVQSVVAPNANYYHLAGIQMLGDLLAAPLESSDSSDNGLVCFYNVGNLAAPAFLYTLVMPAQKASATAITTYTDSNGVEQCMMMVYEYDNEQMYIYQALASSVANGFLVWTLVTTYTGTAFQTGDEYQSFALVTQTNPSGDVVYLLGFREDEELWLWTVNTTVGSSYGTPTLVPNTPYTGWNGSDWRNGMGLESASTTVLRLFGTDKDPSGSSTYPG